MNVSLLICFTMLPYFYTIDNVLPEDITAWSYWREGIQVSGGQPDGESSVLLSQRLPGLLGMIEVMSNEASYGKLDHTHQQTQNGDGCQ